MIPFEEIRHLFIKTYQASVKEFVDKYLFNEESYKKLKNDENYIKNTKRFLEVNKALQTNKNIGKFVDFGLFMSPFLKEDERPKDWGAHEEILWIFNFFYFLPKEYQSFLTYDKAEWSMENNSCKSPDFVFEKEGKKIGMEVTIANAPMTIPLNLSFINNEEHWPEPTYNKFIDVLNKVGGKAGKKYDLLLDDTIVNTITKKMNKVWDVKDCERKFLIIVVIKYKMGLLWLEEKLLLQQQVDSWNKKFGKGIFERIIIS